MVWCGVVWCGVVCGVWCVVCGVWCVVCGVVCGVWCGVWCGVGVVWCGVVWCGVVWCGVVWCGVVWCGVVWWLLWSLWLLFSTCARGAGIHGDVLNVYPVEREGRGVVVSLVLFIGKTIVF